MDQRMTNVPTSPPGEDLITQRISSGIEQVNARMRKLRRANNGLLAGGIFTSAASTFITGITAAQGPVIGTGTPGWRLACTVGAIFSFVATVAVGLNQRLKIGEKLVEDRECAGRLRALEIALATGSRDRDEIIKEYQELIRAYPELVR